MNWIQLSISEHRPEGHTTPGFQMKADLRMLITPCSEPSPVSAPDWPSILVADRLTRELLEVKPEEGGFTLFCDRRWHVMADGPDGVTLRFVSQGDLLAQCSISELDALAAGKQLGLEEFQNDVRRALGERFGQMEHASHDTDEEGRRVLRVAALGTVEEIPIRWVYYHLSNKAGRRAAYVFTMEADLSERLDGADQALVSCLRFAEPAKPSANSSTTAAAPATKATGSS
jgi:hypothetical protein